MRLFARDSAAISSDGRRGRRHLSRIFHEHHRGKIRASGNLGPTLDPRSRQSDAGSYRDTVADADANSDPNGTAADIDAPAANTGASTGHAGTTTSSAADGGTA